MAHHYSTRLPAFLCILSLSAGAAAQTRAQPSAATKAADEKEIYGFALTLDIFHKIVSAEKDLSTMPQAAPDNSAAGGDETLDQSTQKIARNAQAVAVLRKDGLTPREFVVGGIALSWAGMVAAQKKSGQTVPPEMAALASPANLAVAEQHYDEIAKVMLGGDSK